MRVKTRVRARGLSWRSSALLSLSFSPSAMVSSQVWSGFLVFADLTSQGEGVGAGQPASEELLLKGTRGHSFSKNLLGTQHVPGIVLGPGATGEDKVQDLSLLVL